MEVESFSDKEDDRCELREAEDILRRAGFTKITTDEPQKGSGVSQLYAVRACGR